MFRRIALCSLLTANVLCAAPIYSQDAEAEDAPLRIQQLIPESWIEFPAIDPALPPNYVSKEATGGVIWGPEEQLLNLEEERDVIRLLEANEIIIADLSAEMAQIGPNEFSQEKEFVRDLKKMGLKKVRKKKLKWGEYPVLVLEGVYSGSPVRMAWVGLNSENATVVRFMHMHPQGNPKCCTVWNRFLHETAPLNEQDFFRAKGMNMKDGYTIYTCASASVKATVEKRSADRLLAVRIEPISSDTTFAIKQVAEGRMGSHWKFAAPCTKIFGTMTRESEKYGTCVVDCVITVLTKGVEEFSFDPEQESEDLDPVVIHTQPSR